MPKASSSLFDDLGTVLRDGSPDKHVDMLRRVTDPFLSVTDRLNDGQIGALDGVLAQSVNKIEARAPAAISTRSCRR